MFGPARAEFGGSPKQWPLRFWPWGVCNAQLAPMDERTRSLWYGGEGFCYHGEQEGKLLDPLLRLHCTWGEWKRLHPDSLVLVEPQDARHHDMREGHGAEEYFGRPGLNTRFEATTNKPLDPCLPESEVVVGINIAEACRAYPLHDLQIEGGVLNEELDGRPVVIMQGPEPDSIQAGVFDRALAGRILSFQRRSDGFVDRETGTRWSIEGMGMEGALKGHQLAPIHYSLVRWHSWSLSHTVTQVWRSSRQEAPDLPLGILVPALASWRRNGLTIQVERTILNLERPLESSHGLVIRANGDRLQLHHFDNATAAADHACFFPNSGRRGHLVVESDPEQQFKDPTTQQQRLPEDQIAWSPLVKEEGFLAALEGLAPGEPEYPGMKNLIEGLRQAGYEVAIGVDTPMNQACPNVRPVLSPIARRPGMDNGAYLTINSDLFAVSRFESAAAARDYVEHLARHSVLADRYVLRSIPADMFEFPAFGVSDRPEDKVSWSRLLADPQFVRVVREIVTGADAAACVTGESKTAV